jgi:hypothetical protein
MLGGRGGSAPPSRKKGTDMADVVFIGIALAFFAMCVAYTRGLDRLVRSSEEGEVAQDVTSS